MKKIFKPASFLLYILSLIIFFVIGASIAGVTGAAEGQGLAGGAIVFFYGIIGSFLGLVLAIFICYKSTLKTVININKIFGLLFIVLVILGTYRFLEMQKAREEQKQEVPKKVTAPAVNEMAILNYNESEFNTSYCLLS